MNQNNNSATPTRKEIVQKFDGLIKGTLTREQVAEWAEPWDDEIDMDTDDEALLTAIGKLSSAAFKQSGSGAYLYNATHFKVWLQEFQELCRKNPIQ